MQTHAPQQSSCAAHLSYSPSCLLAAGMRRHRDTVLQLLLLMLLLLLMPRMLLLLLLLLRMLPLP